ncbi:MAG: ATP-binding protein [Hyphomicrobiaceae bacterium]|nr:ATP-binding protein [Hyphomicrobiaceae bacterium]
MPRSPLRRRLVTACLVAVGISAAGALMWQTARLARSAAVAEIHGRSAHTLALVVENLRGELAKHQLKVELLAAHPDITRALRTPTDTMALDRLNRELARITAQTGALDTYVMDRGGTTVAASNWAIERTFIGRNFDFRPYFKTAMTGRLGRYFGVGTTSGERGYYLAQPVVADATVIGAVVVKMDVGRLETGWRASETEIVVADEADVVFLSTRQDLVFGMLRPISASERAWLDETRRYFGHALKDLGADRRTLDGARLLRFGPDGAATAGLAAGRDYLVIEEPMPEAGWSVIILADTAAIPRQVNIALAVAGFMLASLVLAAVGVHQRRRRLAERLAYQDLARAELEQKVKARTGDLEMANVALRAEIAERQLTEARLRETQADLIQASKLAALGQLSAGLSHELNQPLAAIRSYAENARAFLDRGRPEPASGNLASIAELTERMARIIKNLRTYARKEPTPARPTALLPAVSAALGLIERRIAADGVTVDVRLPPEPIVVIAGDVRLQQVFVNLITNALDAMQGAPERRLDIAADFDGGDVVITIRDSGSGIPDWAMGKLFDPFFSTKQVGEGTGLGLSISYGIVEQFGGSIQARNVAPSGAAFEVRLKRADLLSEAAE